ncbi:MAG: type II toxin-antitoxin system VapC family toxin [Candidatus Omnitrophica bacterium]|nr:type II toxin-antitoxin system VapC family toxin [Candidatus Omnitrophota bacterium]
MEKTGSSLISSVVVDANVVASWFLPDESAGEHSGALDKIDRIKIHVPSIFVYEFMNILVMAENKGRLNRHTQERILDMASRLPLFIDAISSPGWLNTSVLDIARTYHLTTYDAAYLDLSARLGHIPLLTYDGALLAAAQKHKLKTHFTK